MVHKTSIYHMQFAIDMSKSNSIICTESHIKMQLQTQFPVYLLQFFFIKSPPISIYNYVIIHNDQHNLEVTTQKQLAHILLLKYESKIIKHCVARPYCVLVHSRDCICELVFNLIMGRKQVKTSGRGNESGSEIGGNDWGEHLWVGHECEKGEFLSLEPRMVAMFLWVSIMSVLPCALSACHSLTFGPHCVKCVTSRVIVWRNTCQHTHVLSNRLLDLISNCTASS